MIIPGFPGPSNTVASRNADTQRLINFYPESIDGGGTGGSNRAYYRYTPGYEPYIQTVGSAPVRALFAENGRAFAVAGTFLYELFASQTAISRGVVVENGNPATICTNGSGGNQLFVVSGGHGYVFDLITNVLTEITDVDFEQPSVMGAFIDGYFLSLIGESARFQFSALEDGTDWNGLDFAEMSMSSNQLRALFVNHREVWLFGSKTTEIWYNTGDANTPFAPIGGVFIESGIHAPFSVAKLDNSIFWIGGDERGANVVWKADGYTPTRVSSHAMETALNRMPSTSGAIGWSYQEEGHAFYVLYLPTGDTHWVYDVATHLWHERALWDPDRYAWVPDVGRCHAYGFNTHLVGDRQSGTIYRMAQDLYAADLIIPTEAA